MAKKILLAALMAVGLFALLPLACYAENMSDPIEEYAIKYSDDEYAGYYLDVYDVSGGNVTFEIIAVGPRGNHITSTDKLTSRLSGNKLSFNYVDNWESTGRGEIAFYEDHAKVKVVDTFINEGARNTLDTTFFQFAAEDGSISIPSVNNTGTVYKLIGSSANGGNVGISININGSRKDFSPNAYIEAGTTMVPMRAIFEELGASVDWEAETKRITARKAETSVILTIGDMSVNVNGLSVPINAAPVIVNSSTMIPLRVVSEAFGANVDWDAQNKTVNIYF